MTSRSTVSRIAPGLQHGLTSTTTGDAIVTRFLENIEERRLTHESVTAQVEAFRRIDFFKEEISQQIQTLRGEIVAYGQEFQTKLTASEAALGAHLDASSKSAANKTHSDMADTIAGLDDRLSNEARKLNEVENISIKRLSSIEKDFQEAISGLETALQEKTEDIESLQAQITEMASTGPKLTSDMLVFLAELMSHQSELERLLIDRTAESPQPKPCRLPPVPWLFFCADLRKRSTQSNQGRQHSWLSPQEAQYTVSNEEPFSQKIPACRKCRTQSRRAGRVPQRMCPKIQRQRAEERPQVSLGSD
jgi:hypothetical protein